MCPLNHFVDTTGAGCVQDQDRLGGGQLMADSSSKQSTEQDLPHVNREQMEREKRGHTQQEKLNVQQFLEEDARRDAAAASTTYPTRAS